MNVNCIIKQYFLNKHWSKIGQKLDTNKVSKLCICKRAIYLEKLCQLSSFKVKKCKHLTLPKSTVW